MPWNRVFSCLIDVAELIFLVEANELIFTIIEGASSSAFGLARVLYFQPPVDNTHQEYNIKI